LEMPKPLLKSAGMWLKYLPKSLPLALFLADRKCAPKESNLGKTTWPEKSKNPA
jgi:hypothetical protein